MLLATRKIALEVFRRVVERTPVDTGRAKGNWQPSVNAQLEGALEEVDPGGATVMSKIESEIAGTQPGDMIFLVNNLPYIIRLEEGDSTQAPQGMVAITLLEFSPVVSQVAREVRAT